MIRHQLTARELDVLLLVAQGRTDQQIAAQLGIGRRTVSRHVSVALGKLEAETRTETVRIALAQKVLRFDADSERFVAGGGRQAV